MTLLVLVPLLAAYGAVGWRFRGGAFTALTGIDPGTDGARFLFGGLWTALPAVLLVGWWAALLAPAFFLALLMDGWGGYMAFGHETRTPDRRFPYDNLLRALGLRRRLFSPQAWRYDAAGLALCGLETMWLPAVVVGWLTGSPLHGLGVLAVGLWMPLAYALAYTPGLPLVGKFIDDNTVWGEVFFGAVMVPGVTLLA